LISGFAYERDLARGAGLITSEVSDHAAAYRTQNTDFYLQNVRKLALTISGRDRARGRVVEVPLPDPGEDDGRLISHLVLGQVAEEVERQYSHEQAIVFLEESSARTAGARPSIAPAPWACSHPPHAGTNSGI